MEKESLESSQNYHHGLVSSNAATETETTVAERFLSTT